MFLSQQPLRLTAGYVCENKVPPNPRGYEQVSPSKFPVGGYVVVDG